MHKIEQAAGQVIAKDTQESVDAVDNAVMSLAHLCASIVEVSKASKMPVGSAQMALASAGEGLSKLIASRAEISATTRELTLIQRRSTLRETAFGCPGGVPVEPTGLTELV
ncbi:hypothetical protein [Aurantiacibacter luteus]|uniref:Methyl-accepting transducer domain-containing protein n=1 Tax=Aurantiacibacter luteus TaxID=1581420 RepID=A0A0G9MVK5_9SPHN|nr:hypothetical protein [Aurantiacibacter luteus]KLE34740.1 hypothetical protein AAW00_11355 [Aurantiacibacter luteus]